MYSNAWLQLIQPSIEATYNMICFPFAGGFAEYYLPWQHQMTNLTQICPIQLPGRSYRWHESTITEIDKLISTMLPFIELLLYERPYFIFGHSMGGYIAYEFCKLLMDKKLPLPLFLVVSSIPAPKYWLQRKSLSQLSQQEFIHFFMNLGGIHPEFQKHEKFLNMQMSLLREDIMLCESCSYSHPAKFPFPIVAIGGKHDEYVAFENMHDWCLETIADYEQYEFAGRHFYLNQHLKDVLLLIQKRITV